MSMTRVLDDFKTYYPHLYEKTIKYYLKGPHELIAELNDGSVISFYALEKSFRTISDVDVITEESCKRELGIRLRRLMYERCITQQDLSERTGIHQPRISSYIQGKASPSFYNLRRIAKVLNCSLDDFYCTRKE